jgi:hypothetical protein
MLRGNCIFSILLQSHSQARRHNGDNQQKAPLASMGREHHARRAHRYQATD